MTTFEKILFALIAIAFAATILVSAFSPSSYN